MDAKAYLRQLEKLDFLIKNKIIEKQQWKEIALNITGSMDGERVQSSGSQQKMADAITKCIAVESEIDSLIDKLIDTKRDVIHTIEQLESPAEYDVLHRKYIQYKTLWEISEEYGKDYTTITTLHGRALKKVQAILDGKKEEA